MSTILLIMMSSALLAGLVGGALYLSRRILASRRARNLSRALTVCHAVLTATGKIPQHLITRDLRRGLVLLLNHHLNALAGANPHHLHLSDLQAKVIKLNRMPSGLQRTPLRSKQGRRDAMLALEQLVEILRTGTKEQALAQKTGDLARAAANFAAQQIAIEIARQAAVDAENVRAYPQALNFAYQARGLCRKLPPLIGQALSDSIGRDIERLESLLGKPARI